MTVHSQQTNFSANTRLYAHYSWGPNSLLARLFSHPTTLRICLPILCFLLALELFIINPTVDSGNGLSIFQLQFATNLSEARAIIQGWGDTGLLFYVKWLVADYLLATTYIIALTAALVRAQITRAYAWKPWTFYLPAVAGTLDIMENTLHLCLASNELSTNLAFQCLHAISTLKWLTLGLIFYYLVPKSKTA